MGGHYYLLRLNYIYMSRTTKWVIVVVIALAVLFGLWQGGYLSQVSAPAETEEQSAAAIQGTAPAVDFSDARLATESAVIEAQMKVLRKQSSALGATSSAAQVRLYAEQIGSVATLITKLSPRLQARESALGSLGLNTNAIQSAISSLNLQVFYADDQVGAAIRTLAGVKQDNGDAIQASKNSSLLTQAQNEAEKARTYLEAAVKNIKVATNGFKAFQPSKSAR